ncbi:hypothetical protein ABKN59_002563 [Abortiporus biennis]
MAITTLLRRRPITTSRLPKLILSRCLSSSPTLGSPYHDKVRAYPFVVSKEEALYAASFTATMQPTLMKAIYVPTWIIDGMAVGNAWLPEGMPRAEATERPVTVSFRNSIMPGLTHPNLSKELFYPSLGLREGLEPVPFTKELETQHGMDVLSIPYSFTPFALPKFVNSLSFQDAVIEEPFRFDPTSVQFKVLAAYPVLFPIYLMHYDSTQFNNDPFALSVTIAVEAILPQAAHRIVEWSLTSSTEKVPEELAEIHNYFNGMLTQSSERNYKFKDSIEMIPGRRRPSSPSVSILSPHASTAERLFAKQALSNKLDGWMRQNIGQDGSMKAYEKFWKKQGGEKKFGWEDPRIRPYSLQETGSTLRYVGKLEALVQIEAIANRVRDTVNDLPESEKEMQQNLVQGLIKETERTEAEATSARPEWLKELEDQDKPRSSTTASSSSKDTPQTVEKSESPKQTSDTKSEDNDSPKSE